MSGAAEVPAEFAARQRYVPGRTDKAVTNCPDFITDLNMEQP
jgi:hypothetical protein